VVDLVYVALAALATGLVLIFQGYSLWLASRMPRLGPAGPSGTAPPPDSPLVSAVIAARNEEEDLPKCLDGLTAQDYRPMQITVVDGASTDRTRALAEARAPAVRVIEEPTLPEGWVGKNWACDVGYRASQGEYLLFTDADMRYHPTAVRSTVEWAQREHADLATLAPHVETVGFWEKVVMPFYVQVVLTYFRTPLVNRDSSRAAMANGQFLLVRRDAYEYVGGHAAIRGAVFEDVRLAQEFRRAHKRLRVAWAPDLLATRMYRDRHEMFEGLLKSVHGTEYSTLRQMGFLAALIGFFWLPLGLLPLGLVLGSPVLSGLGTLLWVALFGKHVVFAKAIRGSAAYGLLFPLAVGYYLVIVGTSISRGLRGSPLVWKGRSYPR